MDFAEARNALINGYANSSVTVRDEGAPELTANLAGIDFKITEAEIEQFASNRTALEDASVAPIECSYCSPTTREQLVRPVDLVRGRLLLPVGSRDYTFRRGDDPASPTVRIGPASDMFVDFFRFEPAYLDLTNRRMRSAYVDLREVKKETFRHFLHRPATVQVTGLTEETTTAAVIASTELINAALFTMSYLKGIPYRLMEHWPPNVAQARPRPFPARDRIGGFLLELPPVRYNDDLLRFYQLGIGTEIPELQYLAFYQVLEYFFVQVADETLYATLRARIANPAFRAVPRYLDQIIQDVLSHAKTTDETEMLKLVIAKYVPDSQLGDFIVRYEEHLGEKWYTRRRDRFGVPLEVKIQAGHLAGNVAAVVKTVRNALVHSSDRFERIGRHVPFSESSELVKTEVPLLKFVAEAVIIGSAEPAS